MIKIAYVLLLLGPAASYALDRIALDLGSIRAHDWQMKGVHLSISSLNSPTGSAEAVIDQLSLPEPFDHLSLVKVQCKRFILANQHIACESGEAELKSDWLEASKIAFVFSITEQQSRISIRNIKFVGGTVSLVAVEKQRHWQLALNAEKLSAAQIQKIFPMPGIDLTGGNIDLQVNAEGDAKQPNWLSLDLDLANVSVQTADGKFAAEGLNAGVKVDADNQQETWQWHAQAMADSGAVYAEPVFIDLNPLQQSLELRIDGSFRETDRQLSVSQLFFQHPGLLTVQGRGELYRSGNPLLQKSILSLQSKNMAAVSKIYLAPFFEATALQGVTLAGTVQAKLTLDQQRLSEVDLLYRQLQLHDAASRIRMRDGTGHIRWTDRNADNSQSTLAWDQLDIYDLPFGRARLSLTTDAGNVSLNQPAELPLLDGTLQIQRFDFKSTEGSDPDVHFIGKLEQVSLERLTTVLHLTPLSGTVSGEIPGVSYKQGKLSLDGELNIHAFDGAIRIKKLASSGLFSELPQLYADVEIDDLDLKLITNKFAFGSIEGRLSGFVHDLYLENWQPAGFYAWLGTPDNDDSRHRISQKAVQNIANIGGGGAADLISRSFLGIFETFGYDRLGMGCYLHDGVCQLMGVAPAEHGYYIVEGGGLPRIDVIGYNPRIDWQVLLERIKRVATTSEAVVE